MKIRSALELSQALETSLAWRKKEVSAIHLLIQAKTREHERESLRRAAVPLLYGHWEGFAKLSAENYLEMVSRQNLRHRDLKTNFVALSCRGALIEAASSTKAYIHAQIVDFFIFNQDEKCKVPYRNVIKTSNLNAETLRDVFFTLGLDYHSYWISKEPLLDGSLLRVRNEIAHGARVTVDQTTYDQLHQFVLDITSTLKDTIENAAVQRSYLR